MRRLTTHGRSALSCQKAKPAARNSHMKFGIFYEHQLPRPWQQHSEFDLLQDSLTQIELADKLGYDAAHGALAGKLLAHARMVMKR